MSLNKNVTTEENALNELELFINKWVLKPEPKEKLKDSYPNLLEALMIGNLVIDEKMIPSYKLRTPVLNDKNEVTLSEISFKTRIKPSTQADLADGLDLNKSAAKFALRCIAYITGQATNMLDNFDKEDYNLIREVSAVFM